MASSDIAKVVTNYTYDTLGNLVLETVKSKSVDYEYNELNQLVRKTTSTCNGQDLRVNNLVATHAGKTYDRDYVIDYTSPENDDLYVYAMGNGQLGYEQRHVYAGSERLEQITEKGNGGWERTLYVHEDVMGNTRYYTKATGQTFAELQYDAWGQPISPNKLVNNDHGNYVFATFTGHIYDPVLDIYFAETRFYDLTNRTWMAMDPIKDGLNWYQYCLSNPTTNWDPTGLAPGYFNTYNGCSMPPIVIDWGTDYVLSVLLGDKSNSLDLILAVLNDGYRVTETLYRNGTDGTLNLYYNAQVNTLFSNTFGAKINVGDFSSSIILGDKIGVKFSMSEGDVTNYFTATYNFQTTKITVEWGITGPSVGNTTVTKYTSVTTSLQRLAPLWGVSQLTASGSSIPVPSM